ncbi:hypothetical protein PV726_31905 [Streptomyces europaeiscabiei]|uniref:hypothetical protein n=1 Tax=Streptomyces europaeiscabiei TaxID=146819 RepID=UPI0029BD5A94|nr:hypothetical protein [Streptomyces europaeiscabiei]MDX3694860.1 hypothetical protein [Streptomyces europaeiscabiei]
MSHLTAPAGTACTLGPHRSRDANAPAQRSVLTPYQAQLQRVQSALRAVESAEAQTLRLTGRGAA